MKVVHTLELGDADIEALKTAGKLIKQIRETVTGDHEEASDNVVLSEDAHALLKALKDALAFVGE